jgi:hypothetical protein
VILLELIVQQGKGNMFDEDGALSRLNCSALNFSALRDSGTASISDGMSDAQCESERGIQNLFALSWLPEVESPAGYAMLVAYMDESGTHDETGVEKGADVAVVAGYVSTYKGWVRFQKKWGKVLRRYGVHELHMKYFAHCQGEFEGWSDEKRKSLMIALIKVIDECKLFGLGGIVSVKEYDAILPDWAKAEIKHPYYFAVAVMLKSLAQWDKNIPPGKIDFVFDEKEGYQGVTHEMFNMLRKFNPIHAERLGNLDFRSSKIIRPLQAADLLAYETRIHGSNLLSGSKRPIRGSLQALMKDSDLIVGQADAEYLRAHVAARKRQVNIQ